MLVAATVEQHLHDLAQVSGGNAQAARGTEDGGVAADHVTFDAGWRALVNSIGLSDPGAVRLPGFRLQGALAVQGGRVRHVLRREGCRVIAAAHIEGIEQQTPHQQVEALARDFFHHGADHAPVEVGICKVTAGRCGAIPHAVAAGRKHVAQAAFGAPGIAARVAQRGSVAEQAAQGHGLLGEMRVAQGKAQIDAHVLVQAQLALLEQPHQAQRGHHLRYGSDAKQGGWRHGQAVGRRGADVPVAKLLLIRHLAMANGQHGQAGQRMHGIVDDGGQRRIERALLCLWHAWLSAAAGRGSQRRPGRAQQ